MKTLVLIVFFAAGCMVFGPDQRESEYVVELNTQTGNPYFYLVLNLLNDERTPVYSVRELKGTYFLPFMSRMPEFDGKVVTGYFSVDSSAGFARKERIFVITATLRDSGHSMFHGGD